MKMYSIMTPTGTVYGHYRAAQINQKLAENPHATFKIFELVPAEIVDRTVSTTVRQLKESS